MRLRWSEQARADLIAIVEYVSAERPEAARKLAARIRASMRATVEHPFIGRCVPELDVANIRERIVPPYRVIYQVRRDDLVVLAVVHAARDYFGETHEESK